MFAERWDERNYLLSDERVEDATMHGEEINMLMKNTQDFLDEMYSS